MSDFRKTPMPQRTIRQFLAELKSRNLSSNVPSISVETGEFLGKLVREHSTMSLLELGTAHGYSTVRLAAAMDDAARTPGSKLKKTPRIVTVDFSKPSYDAAVANVSEAGFASLVEHVFADALNLLPTLADQKFDAVFIDAEKRSTARLFEMAWPLVRQGGWLVVDDVVKFREKMADFYALVERLGIPYEIVMTDSDDGIMVFLK
jgi:predicted O-methyltransferase YrrM